MLHFRFRGECRQVSVHQAEEVTLCVSVVEPELPVGALSRFGQWTQHAKFDLWKKIQYTATIIL